MNRFKCKQPITQGIFIALSMLASLADAADLSTENLRVNSSASSAAGVAQPQTAIQNITASPVATEAQTKKVITQPVLTPGAEQSLNPQPLPPGGSVIKPMPGTSIDMANPRIDSGIKPSPGLIQPLPPGGGLIKPMPGASIDMAKPRIDSGIKPSPGHIQPVIGTLDPAATSAIRPGMEERAIIIVGGKQLTVGELKKNLVAEIAAKAGPPKTVKSSARKLDFAQPASQNTLQRSTSGKGNSSISAKAEHMVSLPGKGAPNLSVDAKYVSPSEVKCPDKGKGPPKISEIEGKLVPGKRVTVWGECFGERTGRVEIIGQFPGDKLNPAFVSWDQNSIEIEIPANIREASDHATTLTVVTADGKTSAAMKAQFVAARERIEVPDRLWAPHAKFELSSDENTEISQNKAYSGKLATNLRINPKCALETMDVVARSGNVTAINGWDEPGPLNEARVTLDWAGTCSGRNATPATSGFLGIGSSFGSTAYSACRVEFQTLAWAYCPVGVAP